jgi:hypothetical protein
LQSFANKLSGKYVEWCTDNKNCIQIHEKGSMKTELHNIAKEIHSICLENSISLSLKWIRRDENRVADEYSKLIDYDDYGVSDEFFNLLDSFFGPHDLDRFANDYNNKLPRFNSLFWTPSSENVDAFTQNWAGENNWLVPPVFLIPKTINHLIFCKARGTLVAPYWPSSAFFPMLFGPNSISSQYIKEVLLFNDPTEIYIQGRNKDTIFWFR